MTKSCFVQRIEHEKETGWNMEIETEWLKVLKAKPDWAYILWDERVEWNGHPARAARESGVGVSMWNYSDHKRIIAVPAWLMRFYYENGLRECPFEDVVMKRLHDHIKEFISRPGQQGALVQFLFERMIQNEEGRMI